MSLRAIVVAGTMNMIPVTMLTMGVAPEVRRVVADRV